MSRKCVDDAGFESPWQVDLVHSGGLPLYWSEYFSPAWHRLVRHIAPIQTPLTPYNRSPAVGPVPRGHLPRFGEPRAAAVPSFLCHMILCHMKPPCFSSEKSDGNAARWVHLAGDDIDNGTCCATAGVMSYDRRSIECACERERVAYFFLIHAWWGDCWYRTASAFGWCDHY